MHAPMAVVAVCCSNFDGPNLLCHAILALTTLRLHCVFSAIQAIVFPVPCPVEPWFLVQQDSNAVVGYESTLARVFPFPLTLAPGPQHHWHRVWWSAAAVGSRHGGGCGRSACGAGVQAGGHEGCALHGPCALGVRRMGWVGAYGLGLGVL